jgi:hypothetical protein
MFRLKDVTLAVFLTAMWLSQGAAGVANAGQIIGLCYPFRGDDAHTGAPFYQDRVVVKWYDQPQEKAAWRQVRDWLFLDRFGRTDAVTPGTADFPPLPWKSVGPVGSTAIHNGELVIAGAGGQLVGVYNEATAAPVYTTEGMVTFNQTNAPNQCFVLLSDGWVHRLGLMAHSDGFIYYMTSSKYTETAPSDLWIRSDVRYETNKAYEFKIWVDCVAKTGKYSFGGKELGTAHFAKYGNPSCFMAATQDSRGTFRLGEIVVYKGMLKPTGEPK